MDAWGTQTQVLLLHGFEQSLSMVREGHEQFELGTSCLLDWKICGIHTHLHSFQGIQGV